MAIGKSNMKIVGIVYIVVALVFGAGMVHAQKQIGESGAWIAIGDTDNTGETHNYSDGGELTFGSVGYSYDILNVNVSIAAWEEFHNAEDSGKVGSFPGGGGGWRDYNAYEPRGATKNSPVVYVSFHQAAQYCNWLTSGDATEGAYTINGSGKVKGISRDRAVGKYGTVYALPSEDEWYKAAYYDAKNGKYFRYGTGSDSRPARTPPPATGNDNAANYGNVMGHTTEVGAYVDTTSAYGLHDMAGNTWEWMEDVEGVIRGGCLNRYAYDLISERRITSYFPRYQRCILGFRIVAISEPGE